MRILDIKNFPIRVKLNQNFQLEESFDVGTILQLNSWEIDFSSSSGTCYKINVTVLKSDIDHNKSISIRNWKNFDTGNFELDIFEARKEMFDSNGNFHDTIFVMEVDDCFDLVDDNKTLIYNREDMLLVIKEIAPSLLKHINVSNVDEFIETLRRNN